MTDKYQRFRVANEATNLTALLAETIGKWGTLHIDHVEVALHVAKLEGISPTLLTHAWQNESAFKFYPEANTNNSDDEDHWDVGSGQTNRRVIKASIANQFLSVKGIDLLAALSSTREMFTGDPIMNLRLSARLLKRIGRGTITGPSGTVLYKAAQGTLPEDEWDERRAVAYTGPDARPARLRSWQKFSPLYDRFYAIYSAE